jgi:hypothetical protein
VTAAAFAVSGASATRPAAAASRPPVPVVRTADPGADVVLAEAEAAVCGCPAGASEPCDTPPQVIP